MTHTATKTLYEKYAWHLPYGLRIHFGGPHLNVKEQDSRRAWFRSLDPTLAHWISPKLEHAATVLTALCLSEGLDNQCDGMVTTDPDVALTVFGSDCPGLVLVSKTTLGIAHCGWRGISKGIVSNLVDAFRAQCPNDPSEIYAFIGPGICQDCYDVRSDVISAYAWPKEAVRTLEKDRFQLDLSATLRANLRDKGIHHVTLSGVCTACAPDLHSYRHDGAGTAQLLAAFRSERI
jgi:YfiH family protein